MDLGKVGRGYGIAARLAVSLPGMDAPPPRPWWTQPTRSAPYSNATRGNIDVTITLV